MTKIEKALSDMSAHEKLNILKETLMKTRCPHHFGLKDIPCNRHSNCKECWNGEVSDDDGETL